MPRSYSCEFSQSRLGEHPSPVENFSLAVSVSCRAKTRDFFLARFFICAQRRVRALVPSCTFVVQALTFSSRQNNPISLSKSADSNSPSHCDAVRAPTHRAVVNPAFTNLLQGLPPSGPLITQCYTPANEVQGPARQSPKNCCRPHRSR